METALKIGKPYTKPTVKRHNVHRNDPYPYRSGKKYKNCCQLVARLKEQKATIEYRLKRLKE